MPFHEDQTCEEYQVVAKRRSEEEEKSLEAVKQVSRPCPGPGCGVNIDKFAGCDHVTCESIHVFHFGLSLITDRFSRPEVHLRVLL